MNGKERVQAALRGEPADRPATGPLAVHFCARQAGVTIQEYTMDAQVLSDCVLRYFEKYRPDAIWVSADTWVTAEAMGCDVRFTDPDQPLGGTGGSLVTKPSDLDRIAPPDPSSQGRMPLMLEAFQRVKQAVGDDAFVVGCLDQLPFSLGCALMDINRMMLTIIDDPPMVEALLNRCVGYCTAYAVALAEAGADMVSGGDSPSGLIGPQRYREFALPAASQVFQEIRKSTDVPISLHICGDSTEVLKDMAGSGANVLEFDYQVDAGEACRIVGPDIALWGNLDPVGLLVQKSPDDVQRASRAFVGAMEENAHRRYVLSSGCTLAVETPDENLRAMLEGGSTFNFQRSTSFKV